MARPLRTQGIEEHEFSMPHPFVGSLHLGKFVRRQRFLTLSEPVDVFSAKSGSAASGRLSRARCSCSLVMTTASTSRAVVYGAGTARGGPPGGRGRATLA